MISKRYTCISTLITLLCLTATVTFAQDVVTLDPYDVNSEGLVAQIEADKAANGDVIPEGRVYELIGGETYLNQQVLYVEANETLHIRSSNDEKPIIYQFQSGTGDSPNDPPGYLFRSRGGDMIIDGIAVSGYFEPGDEDNQNYEELYTVQGGLLRTDNPGASIMVTNSIFSNIAGQVLRTEGSTETIRFEDVIFSNLGALSTSNFGAGKGIDLRETAVDSLIMINNTFVNYQDRPIRHYNFGDPTAGTGEIGYGLFDHNTFVNGMGFHGVLSLGTVGDDIIITNNLFVDAFSAGEDSTDETRTAEWANTGEQYDNGNNRMAWIFANPNESTNWVVENNYYAVSSEGQGFFDQYDEINVGDPLSIYIRDALGAAADDAFTMIDAPDMTNIPDLMTGLMTYYVEDAGKTKDTPNDTWDPATQDMDRRPLTYYVSDFDASYATSSEAYTGAADGFPVGDLNWFPAQKEEWQSEPEEPQEDVVTLNPYNVDQEGLVAQINADKAANGDVIPEGRVYELTGGETYLNQQVLYIEANETLHIRSSNDEKPIIYQFQSGTGDSPNDPPGYLFRSRGGDMIIDGIAVSGYYEPGDEGNEDYEELYTVQGGLLRTDNPGASIMVTNSIFSNIAGQVLRTEGSTETIRFEDVIFSNLGALSTSNFGAGKGIDLRETAVDSLILINNTFVNYQDRPIRHYNFGDPTAGTGEIGYGLFDHNTFVNGMGFHGVLSLGTVGDDIIITNNLFVDAFAAGEDSTDETRTAEWANTGEQYDNGNNRMAWIFANPNESTNWVVDNNYYAVSSEGQGFFDQYDEINVGDPLSIYIREALGDDADDAFTMIDDPNMANIPDLMTGLMTYYVEDAGKTKDTPNDTWDPATQDMDRRPLTYFISDFDASYATTSEAYTGAAEGFPAGDLNWFPAQKDDWVTTSIDDISRPGDDLPQSISLNQNYPNPFNPSTTISYDLSQASNVQLEVYDILGKRVATLVKDDFQSAGSHTVRFDASSLSSGMYIYMLRADGITHTRKMTLIK